MKTILLILTLIITNEVYSQTFKVSDLKIYGLSDEETQKKKKDGLGAKIELIFYEKSVKVIIYEQNGEIDDEVVLDQDDKNKNRYVNIQKDARSTLKIELTLNTIINYIHSATLSTSWKRSIVMAVHTKKDQSILLLNEIKQYYYSYKSG